MRQSRERRVAEKTLNPMIRLLCFYEISNYYTYLPGKGEESVDYAWGFYDVALKEILKSIYFNPDLDKDEEKHLLQLYNDIKGLIISEDYIDALVSRWCEVEPKLLAITNRARIFSDLMEEGAFETILNLGFDENDLMIDILRRNSGLSTDSFDETMLLINAFIIMAIAALDSFDSKKLVAAISDYLSNESNWKLSEEEVSKAVFYAGVVDVTEMMTECVYRMDMIRNKHGEFKISIDIKKIKEIQNKENIYPYGIIREDDADYYMIVEPSKLYWELHESDTFVQCYKVSSKNSGYCHIPVEVRDGILRVHKDWKE